jgi:hypothetical protein
MLDKLWEGVEEAFAIHEIPLEAGDILLVGKDELPYVYRGLEQNSKKTSWVRDNGRRKGEDVGLKGNFVRHPLYYDLILSGRGKDIGWRKEHGGSNASKPLCGFSMLAPPAVPKLVSYTNSWVAPIVVHIASIYPVNSEAYASCVPPLEHLFSKHPSIQPTPLLDLGEQSFYESIHISEKNLMADLMSGAWAVDVKEAYTGDTGSLAWRSIDLLVSMASASRGPKAFDQDTGRRWITAALNIRPSTGLGSEPISVRTPLFLQDVGDIAPVTGGFPDRTSAITSAGYLTEPHFDYYGVPQLILHISGRKLWFVWPASMENLDTLKTRFASDEISLQKLTIGFALENLKGLKLYYCTRQDEAFVLEPYAIHAVISETTCGHVNKLFTSFDLYQAWTDAHGFLTEKLVSNCRQSGNDPQLIKHAVHELREGAKAFLHWESLFERYPTDPLTPRFKKDLNGVKEKVIIHTQELEKALTKNKRKRDIRC